MGGNHTRQRFCSEHRIFTWEAFFLDPQVYRDVVVEPGEERRGGERGEEKRREEKRREEKRREEKRREEKRREEKRREEHRVFKS